MLELVSKNINTVNVIKVKSWDFAHGFIDSSLDFSENSLDWNKFSKTEILLLNQVHGSVIVSHESVEGQSNKTEADGWFSSISELSDKNISLGIKTADCSPVILYGANSGLVAVLHCGWRSAYAGILEDCIKKFKQENEKDIEIAIGPAAQSCSYEVGLDLVEKFNSSGAISKNNGKYFLSIPDYLKTQANKLGVEKIVTSDICTIKNESFFSYRRQKEKSGRQISFVG